MDTSLLNQDDFSSDDIILHEYEGSLHSTTYTYLPLNTTFIMQLCENDLIIKNKEYEFRIIYHHIIRWKFTSFSFYFIYKDLGNTFSFTFIVNDGRIIADKLHKITSNLVEYYKHI